MPQGLPISKGTKLTEYDLGKNLVSKKSRESPHFGGILVLPILRKLLIKGIGGGPGF